MIIEGYFPISWSATSKIWRRNHPSHTVKADIYNPEATAYWAPFVNGAISRDAHFYLTGSAQPPVNHFGPYNVKFSGDVVPNPPDVIWSATPTLSNNHPFKKKVRERKIVVSDFEKGGIRASFTNGQNILSVGKQTSMHKNMPDTGLLPKEDVIWAQNGTEDVRGSIGVKYQFQKREVGKNPYELGWNNDYLAKIFTLCFRQRPGSVILNTVADANAQSVDISTALAELPKAASGILDVCMRILQMYKDARKKAFWWHKKVSKRKYDYHQGRITAAQLERDVTEFNDALAEIWLSYRLSIEPSILTLVDFLGSLPELGTEYHRWRDNSVVDIQDDVAAWVHENLPDWEVVTVPQVAFRVFIKRGFSPTNVIPPEWSHNLFTTAWELVPLSFMVDRVIGIGNWISGLTTRPNWESEGSTLSWKVSGNLALRHKTTDARVNLEIGGYKRMVFNPSDYCRVYLDPDMSGKRAIDALALTWALFLRRFTKN